MLPWPCDQPAYAHLPLQAMEQLGGSMLKPFLHGTHLMAHQSSNRVATHCPQAMEQLGDPTLKPFLQDVIQLGPLVKTMGKQARRGRAAAGCVQLLTKPRTCSMPAVHTQTHTHTHTGLAHPFHCTCFTFTCRWSPSR